MKYPPVNITARPWQIRYPSGGFFLRNSQLKLLLIGMSGVGKTYLSTVLSKNQKHYSVDYLIGAKYLTQEISDSINKELKTNPYIEDLLNNQALKTEVSISSDNLCALSFYIGLFGSKQKNGLPLGEFVRRQKLYLESERKVMFDLITTIENKNSVIVDTTGSFCELFSYPIDFSDPLIKMLRDDFLVIYLEADNQLNETLIQRQRQAPKPMCYEPDFFQSQLQEYCKINNIEYSKSSLSKFQNDNIDPKDFSMFVFRKCIHYRKHKYQQIADFTGITIPAKQTSNIDSSSQFYDLVAKTIDEFHKSTTTK